MRELFTAPLKTSYHDNTTWLPNRFCGGGTWLKPGEKLVVLTPEEGDLIEKVQSQFNVIVGQANEIAQLQREIEGQKEMTDAQFNTAEKLRAKLKEARTQIDCALDYMEGRTRVSFSGKQWNPSYLKALLVEGEEWEAGK